MFISDFAIERPIITVVTMIALIVFGPKRLPVAGRSLGRGMREFKDGLTGKSDKDVDELPRSDGTSSS